MDYDAYVAAMQAVSKLVDEQQYDEALAGMRTLLESDLLDRDKSILCLNMAVVYDKMAKPSEVLAWYDRGMDYERNYRPHLLLEHKAGYLIAQNRQAEALAIYESLLRERSIDEAEKQRFSHNVGILRTQLGRG
ncbi:MAG TPA: hypothetical protein VGR62_22820 [Candidatus Binatia bacterium]|jgi:predicted negative regulator of RcsB-dependent stress response|nr:hypothetical protein [Candidatus Binatia bacterium]